MSELSTETKTVHVADGTEMNVFIARPASDEKVPAILVFQEAFGVNDHIRDVAQRFARLGYLAAAPELFHRSGAALEIPYDHMPSAMGELQKLTVEGLEADVRAAFDLVSKDPQCGGRVASIGFCMGGRVSFLANSILPLRAAACFYGGGIAPALLDRATSQNGSLLLVWGGLDKHIGADQRAAIREALDRAQKPYVEVVFSFANHAFFCDQRAAYHPTAAREAWALTQSFLGENV